MSFKDKKVSKKEKSGNGSAVVSENVGNYEKHPFFVKKAASAKELLLKTGLPKQLTKKAHT